MPIRAGECSIAVMLHNEHVSGSPFKFNVEPGDADPVRCNAAGPGLESAVSLQDALFGITARDRYPGIFAYDAHIHSEHGS